MFKKQIEYWVRNGTITQAQADKMLKDLVERKQERTSHQLIVAASTIGSILMGIGAILFVASNWDVMSSQVKVLILVGSTMAAYISGYLFAYQWRNLPRVGASLIFLGTLFFGATVFLIAQIYHVKANNHTLMLIWLFGIIPFVYAFRSRAIAALVTLVYFIWVGMFVSQGRWFGEINFTFWPSAYLLAGLLLFVFGTRHYATKRWQSIARIYRLAGMNMAMLALFALSCRECLGKPGGLLMQFREGQPIALGLVGIASLTIILTLWDLWRNPRRSKTSLLEQGMTIALIITALLLLTISAPAYVWVLIFNLIVAACILLFIYFGYENEDMRLVNMGMFWLFIFILARYFDLFWDMMPRSLFFIGGGFLLVLGSAILERKRRKLKELLGKRTTVSVDELKKKQHIFIILGVFSLAIISGFIAFKERIVRTGHEVMLEAKPIDPRDLFRGDYVILNYDISDLNLDQLPADTKDFKPGDSIYVALRKIGRYSVVSSISSRPLVDTLFIKGIVKNRYNNRVHIDYGIESYFVPEKKGKEIETSFRTIEVKVAISESGHAVIKELYISGEPFGKR